MTKNYFYIIIFSFFSFSFYGQENKDNTTSKLDLGQELLTLYPNPASADKIFINSKNNLPKEIEFFNVLGKKVLQTTTLGKEINISALTPGVYLIKIKEGEVRVTRKLVVK